VSEADLRLDRSAIEAREIDGELVIYDLSARRYLGGNRTAALLWPLLLEGTDLEALTEALQSGCGIDADRARADSGAFVDSLRSLGLMIGPED
jgi:hypothetical protein